MLNTAFLVHSNRTHCANLCIYANRSNRDFCQSNPPWPFLAAFPLLQMMGDLQTCSPSAHGFSVGLFGSASGIPGETVFLHD